MWTFITAQQHKPLLVLRRLYTPVSSYHVTTTLLWPKASSIDAAGRKHLRGSKTRKPAVSGRWQDCERSVQSKALKSEIPYFPQKHKQGMGDNCRLSSELRKLSLEDFSAEKNKNQVRQQSGLVSNAEIVFGIAPCLLALTQGRRKAHKLFVKDGEASHRASVLKVCEEAYQQGVQVSRVRKKDLDTMSSGGVHQGVCLQATPLSYLTEDSALHRRVTDTPLWLVLERIQDPMNLGAILRTAYFLGVDMVISSLRHSCPLSPVVSKASSGVMEVIEVYGCEKLNDMLRLKVKQGWQVVGTVGEKSENTQIPVTQCMTFQMTKPTLLLMGGEGEGLSQELVSLCQTLLTIPAGRELVSGIESLNVSVATGILLHRLLSSRRSGK
ncbi:rRNA methyltransferase 1, mitochondrial [Parambassis ranga]|uniref:rRNA methyltransferase 1, mitochondrial n=1 Tax=Parambassis ranga TaxID=210632 RepID=A0A6P7KCP9_9TELE|nr:rRNA methyltransferase 1, mitochondrial [Parambassis ranga]